MKVLITIFTTIVLIVFSVCACSAKVVDISTLSFDKQNYIEYLKYARSLQFANDYAERLLSYERIAAPVDVVFLGDSLTYRGTWETLSKDITIVNCGINGDTIRGIELRLDQIVKMEPKNLFLLIGINDLAKCKSVEVLKQYNKLLQDMVIKLPHTTLYIQSILPVRDDVREIVGNSIISEFNLHIKETAKKYDIKYIDIFNSLLDPTTNQLYWDCQLDGLHLTNEGYRIWLDILIPYIDECSHTKVVS